MTQDNNQKEDVDWENLFKPGDFSVMRAYGNIRPEDVHKMSSIANARFREIVERYGIKLYGIPKDFENIHDIDDLWAEEPHYPNTHSATLINVKRIEDE